MAGISAWPSFWGRYGPRRPALVHDRRTVTWGELEDGCARLAAGLAAHGVRPGDRVAVLISNRPEHFELLLACARLGALLVPLNPMLAPAELAAIAADAEPTLLIADDVAAPALDALEPLLGADRVLFCDRPPDGGRSAAALREHGAMAEHDGVGMDDPLLIAYSSGTTGEPKGAVLTHGNCEALAVGVIAMDGLRPSDRALVCVPLAFAGAGVSFAMPILHIGGSLLIRDSLDPVLVLDDIEQRGVSFIGVVPVVLERLARTDGFAERDLTGLTVAKAGGASVPESLLRLYHDRGVPLVNAFGITEGAGCNLELPADDALRKLGSSGLPLLGQTAAVVGDDDRPAPPGEPGELLLGGACVMREYWRRPELTAATVRDGRLHTGDIAVVDEEGYFTIVDRSKDMVITGGINVYPAEIERALSGHPAVVELAVVGLPDERWGERAVACVVSNDPGLTLDILIAHGAGRLADFKWPRELVLRDEPLPRGVSGKVLKRTLREQLGGRA